MASMRGLLSQTARHRLPVRRGPCIIPARRAVHKRGVHLPPVAFGSLERSSGSRMEDHRRYHLRIFLESHCNFRCVYCNPEAERQHDKVISNPEIVTVLDAARDSGIEVVHYSGGEPTLRHGLADIMGAARALGYVEQSMTTNGVLLGRLLPRLRDSGLTSVNISIDSLQRARFRDLTGRDELARVVDAIEAAVVAFGEVKINIVMLDGTLDELPAFIDWAARRDGAIICRFIELQTNQPVFYDP